MNFYDPIPGPIISAICKVMADIGAVKKSNKNVHGNYQFASTDDIYAELAHKMAAANLVCLATERHCEIKRVEKDNKISQWGHFEFGFTLATPEASWTDDTAKRTLYIQILGPQSFQAAQSYAEKAFLRSLFKLPTGDMDLDSIKQAETEEDMIALAQDGQKKRKSSNAAKKDGTDKTFNEIVKAIKESINVEMLQHVRTTYANDWAEAPARWHDILEGDYETQMIKLKGQMV